MIFLSCFFAMTLMGGVCPLYWDQWPQNQIPHFIACLTHADPALCPQAGASGPQTPKVGKIIELDATASTAPFDIEQLSFSWRQVDNKAPIVVLTGDDTATPTFIASQEGTYLFELTVSWYCREATDFVTVDVVTSPSPFPAALDVVTVESFDTTLVQITYASPGDDRLFIVLQDGRILIRKNGQMLPDPFLDLRDLVTFSGERGLLGIAFDPDYTNNGWFYVDYTGIAPDAVGGSANDTRIVAYQVSAENPDLADTNTGTQLLTISQPFVNHNGGQLTFAPDGYLYIGTGDGGGQHDPDERAQNLNSLHGKILRIEVLGNEPYRVPESNPFFDVPGVREEIWAYGLRNPWRFSFDRLTGDLYIADVGQSTLEEVNQQPAESSGGENYGWDIKEGTICHEPTTNCDETGLTDPIFEYSHSLGCSITGGFVYRGPAISGLQGFYVCADFCSARFWVLREEEGDWVAQEVGVFADGNSFFGNVAGFGEDSDGELYFGASRMLYQIIGIRDK